MIDRSTTTSPRGFTLTEIMISLAMVALLLVGISRIFAITSQTIGTGQALSKAVRGQRAIQQVMSADFIGASQLPGNVGTDSGMVTLGGGSDLSAPMLLLSNFRVAAYRNEADARSDAGPAVPGESFTARSAHIRGIDLNNDGDDVDAGETIPLYIYGQRNWRVDSIGFFGKGNFVSQTGSPASTTNNYQNAVRSNNAFIWYGHLAVFNGQLSRIPWQNAFGLPGAELTLNSTAGTPLPKGPLPNNNNQYADQFLLGRFQMLLVPMTDHDNDSATEKTVVAPDLTAVPFVIKTYASPSELSVTRTPLSFSATVRYFDYNLTPLRRNVPLSQDDQLLAYNYNASPPPLQIENCRADIAGVAMKDYYERLRFIQSNFLNTAKTTDRRDSWWSVLLCLFDTRYRINPYPAIPFDARKMSQRSQLLSPDCTQFIVEYAGDFLTQDENGVVQQNAANPNGGRYAFQPDGFIDFVVVNGARQTRWYGMPRDVNADGSIVGNAGNQAPASTSAIYSSPDVLPLRDLLGGRMVLLAPGGGPNDFRPFEVAAPLAAAQYGAVTGEAINTTNKTPLSNQSVFDPTTADVESTGYVCAWGPLEFETQRAVGGVGSALARPVPSLIRIIVDTLDNQGKLQEPVREEYVFPVPVSK